MRPRDYFLGEALTATAHDHDAFGWSVGIHDIRVLARVAVEELRYRLDGRELLLFLGR